MKNYKFYIKAANKVAYRMEELMPDTLFDSAKIEKMLKTQGEEFTQRLLRCLINDVENVSESVFLAQIIESAKTERNNFYCAMAKSIRKLTKILFPNSYIQAEDRIEKYLKEMGLEWTVDFENDLHKLYRKTRNKNKGGDKNGE